MVTSGAAAWTQATVGDIFRPVGSGRAPWLIFDQIRRLLRDGRLKPGDRLPTERELGERLGVSRVTVREALRGLEANGILTIKVGARGGAFVTAPTSIRVGQGIADLFTMSELTAAEIAESRQIFEIGIIPLVVERADKEDFADLLHICDLGDAALADGTYHIAISTQFHNRVAKATHNSAVVMLSESFHSTTLRYLVRATSGLHGIGVHGNSEHREFVLAVSKRDTQSAVGIMRAHILRAADQAVARPE